MGGASGGGGVHRVHELASLQARRAAFLAEHPGYGYAGRIDSIVADELQRFHGEHYVDYTGAGVYTQSQLEAVFAELSGAAFGNSHSHSPSSERTEQAIQEARDEVLRFFGTDSRKYSLVFTSGATAALKLVGESFPFGAHSQYVYLDHNHNSVLGIREYALAQGASFEALTEEEVSTRLAKSNSTAAAAELDGIMEQLEMDDEHDPSELSRDESRVFSLFAFPAEENFSGKIYPLREWIERVESGALGNGEADGRAHRWHVVLDAAAYVPTQRLDLSDAGVSPSFVTLSFYKMFGYPTGLGALLVRNDAVPVLHKRYFGGGTVVLAASHKHFTLLQGRPASRFEDGTVAFLDIVALKHGFEALQKVGGIDAISAHVGALTSYLATALGDLEHSNGRKVLRIFGNHLHSAGGDGVVPRVHDQGSIVTFSVQDRNGAPIGYHEVQRAAAAAGIHLRTGGHCNPGALSASLGVDDDELQRLSQGKTGCGDEIDIAEGTPLGAVRVSLGYLSTFGDVDAVLQFFKTTYTDAGAFDASSCPFGKRSFWRFD